MPGAYCWRQPPVPISPFRRRWRRNGEIGARGATNEAIPRQKCLGYRKERNENGDEIQEGPSMTETAASVNNVSEIIPWETIRKWYTPLAARKHGVIISSQQEICCNFWKTVFGILIILQAELD